MSVYRFPHLDRLVKFIVERHQIYERRRLGQPQPWTKDKILATYRFCNVYRELDRVTIWIAKHWRGPYQGHENLWFAMVIARLINHPDTLAELPWPEHGWSPALFCATLNDRHARGEKRFGSAYIVSTNGQSMDKAEYLAKYVLTPLWRARDHLRPRPTDSLRKFATALLPHQGMGTFMAAQIIADLKYTPALSGASDWWSFAMSGPGSRRGMSYVLDMDPKTKWREHEWKEALGELATEIRPHITDAGMARLHNQDLQNCLCEFSKYRRTQLHTGRPKQKFTPHEG